MSSASTWIFLFARKKIATASEVCDSGKKECGSCKVRSRFFYASSYFHTWIIYQARQIIHMTVYFIGYNDFNNMMRFTNKKMTNNILKETVLQDLLLLVFSWIIFPQTPEKFKWQIMGTLSDCWDLKEKCIYMLILIPNGNQTKQWKRFWLKVLSICRHVNDTGAR